MNFQDWDKIVFTKKPVNKTNKDRSILQNTKSQNESSQKMNKVDNETFTQKKLTLAFRKDLQKARLLSKISQKDLATKLNVKTQVITSYENGTCLTPTNGFITKLEKELKCKLPRLK